MDSPNIFRWVDDLVINPKSRIGRSVLDVQLGHRPLLPFEEKVETWTKEHPVLWNIGIGPTASFAPTLSRLLQERSMELYGPHDLIIHLKVASSAAGSTINHGLALEAFMAIAGWLNIKELIPELQELKQLAADESYYGYGTVSEDLMLRAWGQEYVMYYGSAEPFSVRFDPICERQPTRSPLREKILEASSQGKRYLLVVENLHAPVSLDVLIFAMNKRPSLMHNQWLISPTSTDVYNKSKSSRRTGNIHPIFENYIQEGYYHAVPRGDLSDDLDWSMLITEALKDAARRILQLQQDHGCLYHGDGDDKYWLRIAHHCLYYAILYHGPVKGVAVADEHNNVNNRRRGKNIGVVPGDNPRGGATKRSPPVTISSDELVRCWVAENLVFSSPNGGNPGTAAKKHSNYRSAYQAGKLVIQALQEYSLLPGPYFSTPTSTSRTTSTSAPSQAAVITGVSVLAKGVPRLQQGEFLVPHNKRWVSFMGDDGKHISWPSRKNAAFTPAAAPGEMIMTTLILRCCSDVPGFPLDQVLNCHLRVLDLSYTSIESLPSSFCRLLNLHLLSLRGCSKLQTLSPPPTSETPPPLAHMGKLQILDINGAPLVKLTQQDGANKSNLHYLDLSGSRVTALPSGFFCEMLNLEELILCNCFSLTKLPLSIAQLSNLLVLHVQGTQITTFPEDMFEAMQNLHTLNLTNNMLLLSLPRSLSEAKGLKELHIYNCVSLGSQFLQELTPYVEHLYIQTWDALEHIKILGHPNLTTFTLSGQWVRSLSLNGCSKLKIMNIGDELMALEDVDLSGTALEEVPHNLPNLPQLRMLLLLNVPCLKRFPWHLLVRFPKVFYLDHCTGYHNWFPKMSCSQKIYADGNQYAEKAVNTAQVNITDSRIFYSFNRDVATKLVKEGRFLQSFNVQVKSCSARGKETKMKQGERIQRQSPYLDVHSDEAASIVPMIKLQPRQRHVEISANNQCPQGLRHLLSVTNSIFLIDDTFVECLTDLNYSLMWLEECQIEHCHQMTVVLRMSSESEGSESLSSLKILQASNLNLLQSFVEPAIMSDSSLITLEQLKHIHLEHCPQLEKIFPCSLSLPALETLVILFCSSLKTIFYNQTRYEVAPSPLPNIKSIYLQELPQLQHIHDDVMFRFQSPKLEKLFLRGCQSFHRLPLLNREYLKPKVEVNGERDWWDKLQMTLPEQSGYYVHVPASEFVSCKKHIIESYLR